MKKKMILISFLTLLVLLFIVSCDNENEDEHMDLDYKQKMREFVIGLSEYSKSLNTQFFIIPQNGIELVSENGENNGNPDSLYLSSIDGNGQEDLFYGYDYDDVSTPSIVNTYLRTFLDISKNSGNTILVTDYCTSIVNVDSSYNQNNDNGYISFAADERELFSIPSYPSSIYNENSNEIESLSEIQNFLYLINPASYNTKTEFINAVTATNYDLLIMDLFFHNGSEFTVTEINQLKSKENGGERLLISYMSIGEAEDYRYYWQSSWNDNKPSWLDEENPNWEGNYKVKYWIDEWQNIIYGNDESYLKKIIDAGFDGAYLDIIDAFEYYENHQN